MVDMYCNCHSMIGNMGWMSISGDILKLASCGLLILNTDKMQVHSFNLLATDSKDFISKLYSCNLGTAGLFLQLPALFMQQNYS